MGMPPLSHSHEQEEWEHRHLREKERERCHLKVKVRERRHFVHTALNKKAISFNTSNQNGKEHRIVQL